MEKSHVIGTQKGNLLPVLLAAVILTSLLVGSTGPVETLRSFQSPISPVSPLSSPLEPLAGPATPPQPAAQPSAVSTLVLWIVIGLVVVGTFTVGLVFFQKRRE